MRAMTPGLVRPPWRFEIKLGFEGVVDRFDDLAEGAEVPLCGSGLFCFGGWSDEGDTGLVEGLLEAFASVSFVGDDGLTWAG